MQASSSLLINSSCIVGPSPFYRSKNAGRRRTIERKIIILRQASRTGGNTDATGKSTKGSGPSPLVKSGKARVTVRQAKERDYQGVADIRGVIIPVGMSGATGFLGGKVVIDDPAEAERRLLMAKVCVRGCVDSQSARRDAAGDTTAVEVLSLFLLSPLALDSFPPCPHDAVQQQNLGKGFIRLIHNTASKDATSIWPQWLGIWFVCSA